MHEKVTMRKGKTTKSLGEVGRVVCLTNVVLVEHCRDAVDPLSLLCLHAQFYYFAYGL